MWNYFYNVKSKISLVYENRKVSFENHATKKGALFQRKRAVKGMSLSYVSKERGCPTARVLESEGTKFKHLKRDP